MDNSLIDEHISVGQSQKAISALLRHVRTRQQKEDDSELLPGKEQHVWLVLTVKHLRPMTSLKPHKIPIAHPLVDPRTAPVCLITKDPQREYKDLLDSHNIKFISRVVGVQKLKGKFQGFDARRLLLRENEFFLADDRVVPLLPGLLGKKWFAAKKQPIPVSLTKKDLKGELERAISSTYMHQNRGTCTSIKIANISHKESQVLANLKAAIPSIITRIHGGWANIQSLSIKTSRSVSLPIWTCSLGSNGPASRWGGMDIDSCEWTGIVDDGNGAAGGAAEDMPNVNGKKRAAVVKGEELAGRAKQKKVKTEVPLDNSTPASSPNAVDPDPKLRKKPRKKRNDSPPAKLVKSSLEAVPTNGTAEKQSLEQVVKRNELNMKKAVLSGAKLEKKKSKLRETEKSTRKGAKTQMIGRATM